MDKETKKNLFNQYKQEAIDFHNKKIEEKNKRIAEERAFLEENQKRNMEYEERMKHEKLKRQNEYMDEYNKAIQERMIKKQSNQNINGYLNYSLPHNSSLGNFPSNQSSINSNNNLELVNEYNNKIERAHSPSQREKLMVRREDHMGNFLTDKQNESELKNYFINEKQHQQQFYKEILDNQCQERRQKQLASDNPIYQTKNANIFNYHKRFDLTQDPFHRNNNLIIGKTTLNHNPIINPTNNLEYNRYLNYAMGVNTPETSKKPCNNNNDYGNSMKGPNNNILGNNNNGSFHYNQNQNFNNQIYNNTLQGNGENYYDQMNKMKNECNNIQSNNNYFNPQINSSNNRMNTISNCSSRCRSESLDNNNYNLNGNNMGINGYQQNLNYNQRNNFNQYQRDYINPTPSRQTLRQAAESNFFN